MNLREAQREDVTAILQAFCQLNDIIVDDLHMFVSVIKRDWPALTIDNVKAAIAYWHAGTVDIRKPRKFTLRFFGEMVSAWRNSNVTKNIVDSNRHSAQPKTEIKKPLAEVLATAVKAWDIQYESWCKMLEAGGTAPWGHVMGIDDKNCLLAGVYKETTFTKAEITKAQNQYLKGYARMNEDAKHVRKAINIANVVKASNVDMLRVGRMGAYYNRMLDQGMLELIMNDEVLNVIKQKYNEVS